MSCFGCSRKYGLFCKEYGCPNCGYSYCAKCLKRPVPVPRHENKVLNVCLICYDKLSKLQPTEKVIDCEALPGTLITKGSLRKATIPDQDIDAILGATSTILNVEPVTELGDVLQPISTNKLPNLTAEENSEINENLDCVISKRLKNLKTPVNPTAEDEIRNRLSNLTGMPQKDYSKKDLLLSTDERTDQQKMKDLLEQFAGEAHLDQRVESERNDAIFDIERRLKALRGDEASTSSAVGVSQVAPDTNTPSDNEQDDESMLKDIMQKYLAEARLPTAEEKELLDGVQPPAGTKPGDLEELPWCNICNEDAVYRCKGCDGELFCAQCFRECHDDDEEYKAHEKLAYTATPKFKENHF